VYTHTRQDTGKVFYIGIGCSANYKRAYQTVKRSEYWTRIKKKAGLKVAVIIDNITWKEAESIERYLISKFGREQQGIGQLCNMTDGGDGTTGRIVSDTERESMRQRMLGVYRPQAVAAAIAVTKRPVEQYTKSGEFIKTWDCISDAVRAGYTNNKPSHISMTCRGKRPTAGGYIWKYKEEYKDK
jgi:hypothetical protein